MILRKVNSNSVGRQLLNVPFDEMIYSLANAIAEAQANLDANSIEILRIMGDKEAAPVSLPMVAVGEDGTLRDVDMETSMIGAGFQPTFYQFAETIIEVKMAITISDEQTLEKKTSGKETSISYGRGRISIRSTPVDATYTNKYNFTQEGTSTIRTRLVPVPPNAIIERQIELRSQLIQAQIEKKLDEANNQNNQK